MPGANNKSKGGKGGGGGNDNPKKESTEISPELINQRYELYNTLSYQVDMGGNSAFPGSKRYTETQKARRALEEFDRQHPEVKSHPRAGGSANEY